MKWGESLSVVSNSLQPHGLHSPWNSPDSNTEVGSLSLLQGIFPTQGLNPGLPHYTWILYQLSHQGIPRILEWIAYPFSSGSSWPRNWTGVSCIAGGFCTSWAKGNPFWHIVATQKIIAITILFYCLNLVLKRLISSGAYFWWGDILVSKWNLNCVSYTGYVL